jgi:hypothetical protein
MDGCPECGSNRLEVRATEYGWLVKCSKMHEVFPFPGAAVFAEDFRVVPTTLKFGKQE